VWTLRELGRGVAVRRVVEDDVDGIFAVHGDPAVYRLDPDETHADTAYTRTWLAPILERWTIDGLGYWTVLVPAAWWPEGVVGGVPGDDGRVIAGLGGVQVRETPSERMLNVYYRLGPAVQGRGIASAVVVAAIAAAGECIPDLDLVVRTRPDNGQARRVAERAGFVFEGFATDEERMVRYRYSQRPPSAR
jgi:[ribosomal protein S5]-alanine N-acetyltransferase